MAQQLKHLTLGELEKAVFSEIENCTEGLINNEHDAVFLRGQILAYRSVLKMLGIPKVKNRVVKDSDFRMEIGGEY